LAIRYRNYNIATTAPGLPGPASAARGVGGPPTSRLEAPSERCDRVNGPSRLRLLSSRSGLAWFPAEEPHPYGQGGQAPQSGHPRQLPPRHRRRAGRRRPPRRSLPPRTAGHSTAHPYPSAHMARVVCDRRRPGRHRHCPRRGVPRPSRLEGAGCDEWVVGCSDPEALVAGLNG